jgi:hypothetical protein
MRGVFNCDIENKIRTFASFLLLQEKVPKADEVKNIAEKPRQAKSNQ